MVINIKKKIWQNI